MLIKILPKTYFLIAIALCFVTALAFIAAGAAESNDETGMRFTMTMKAPDRDPVEFDGLALDDSCSLGGGVGGIETVALLTGGKLFILTPAIKTAREIENSEPPGRDESGWEEWLIEPGRINPLAFSELIGLEGDPDGRIPIGKDKTIVLEFEDGTLVSLRFPNPAGDGEITYLYSDFKPDADISAEDFAIPDGYRVAE